MDVKYSVIWNSYQRGVCQEWYLDTRSGSGRCIEDSGFMPGVDLCRCRNESSINGNDFFENIVNGFVMENESMQDLVKITRNCIV